MTSQGYFLNTINMRKTLAIILCTLLIVACSSKKEGATETNGVANLSNKELQYYLNGKKLYTSYCSNCHTDMGTGLGRLIPPLKESDYLLSDLSRAVRIIKFGQRGPLTVNGVEYNQPMPANPNFSHLEIAEIITYISNSWGNDTKGFTLDEVKNALIVDEN